jgi:Tol biopolymer transport system component
MALSPALSADGRFVAYISANHLYVTELRTGDTRQLATGTSLRAPNWTSGGSEVAFQSLDTIYAVSRSGGGQPRVLLAPANGTYAISPDGRRVAWSTKENGVSTFCIGALGLSPDAIDTTVRRKFQPSVLSWSSDGKWLAAGSEEGVTLYSSDGSKENHLRAPVKSDPPFFSWVTWISWGLANDTLYVDGPGPRLVGPRALTATVLSPNGAWRPLMPVDTPANYHASEFSSDGRRFASLVSKRKSQLVRYVLDGGRATRRLAVASGEASDSHQDFSPDGKTAAFVRELESRSDVYVVSSEGGVPRKVTHVNAKSLGAVRWSPDGALIGFTYRTDSTSGVGVVNPATGVQRLIRSDLPRTRSFGVHGDAGLGWTPDGSRLFFGATHLYRNMRVLGGVGMMDLRSGRDSLLDSAVTLPPMVSPSNGEVGFQDGMLKNFVRLDWGTGRRDSTLLPLRVEPIRWERDGTLLLLRSDSSSTEVSRFSLSSKKQTPVAVLPSRCRNVSLSIDSRTAVCEEVETGFEVWVATREKARTRRRFSFLKR